MANKTSVLVNKKVLNASMQATAQNYNSESIRCSPLIRFAKSGAL